MSKPIRQLSDLKSDTRNANRGTTRGRDLLKKSLKEHGAGRSVLADRDGNIIAGNKTLEAYAAIGMENVRVIETTGDELVVVQRTDLSLDSKRGRELAIADNRTGEVNLDWDMEQLAASLAEGIDLSDFFRPDELEVLGAALAEPEPSAYEPTYNPKTSSATTTAGDMEKARQELDAKFKSRIALKPVVCPHCAGEFFLDAEKNP